MNTTAFRIDPSDNESASDGESRYGAYLRIHAHQFHIDDELTLDPAEFATTAFTIAVSPLMSPGYVLAHRRVIDLSVHWDDDRRAAIAVSFVSALPDVVARTIDSAWAGWHRDSWGGEPRWLEHDDNDRPVALPTLLTRIPVPVNDLPKPVYRHRQPDVATAQQAVRTLVTELNTKLAPVLDALTAGGRG